MINSTQRPDSEWTHFKNWMARVSLWDSRSASCNVERTEKRNWADWEVSPSQNQRENLKRLRFLKRRRLRTDASVNAVRGWAIILEQQESLYWEYHPQTLKSAIAEGRECPKGWVEVLNNHALPVYTPKRTAYLHCKELKWAGKVQECGSYVHDRGKLYLIPGTGYLVLHGHQLVTGTLLEQTYTSGNRVTRVVKLFSSNYNDTL